MRWLLLALMGCGSSEVPEVAPEPAGPTPGELYGWIGEVAAGPDQFADLLETSEEGWVALHANDFDKALSSFASGTTGHARAQLARALLHADLADLTAEAHLQLAADWKGELPAESAMPTATALAAWCSGSPEKNALAGDMRDEDGPIAEAIRQDRSPLDAKGTGPIYQRLTLHKKARTAPEALLAVAATPMVVEEGKGFERKIFDPCVFHTLADAGMADLGKSLGSTGWRAMKQWSEGDLSTRFLAPWPTSADLASDLETAQSPGVLGSGSPLLRSMGVGTRTTPDDAVQAARDETASLTAGLDRWSEAISGMEGEGPSVVSDLDLVHRFRQEWLISRARAALAQEHPQQALAYLLAAADKSDDRVGPRNSPSLKALTALAHLRNGHTREALDAIQPLVDAIPAAAAAREPLADLAVLRGLDRHGDSKEN